MDNDDICVRFGKNVRRIRRAKEQSQEDLADKAGLHRTYISGLERGGGRNPSLKAVEKIAKALGVDPRRLLD
ncbi:MAG: helix-turn-helix transcriptional regulator [Blastomonas sp.]